uniref:Uncharacterized protein n=1 Tax=Kwoniella dejecticola CBS 10117 TaxID=1296121 RepID=A0A1A6A8S4_9TREE|nr:uncharacterized protein I303_02459 [Kwoniella dejecticola CBS 10117]OBR86452.1 hypothetical protein I303_02459 [Kwoniella dejecticola CBS 10117]
MSAQPSTSGAAPTSTPIPGAALPSSSKPKRNKKKSTAKSITTAGASSVIEDTPLAPPAPTVKLDENSVPLLSENGIKEKGPVEEVIAKRQRQLIKKLQRFRGYAAQPHESLNADQKAAVASLPAMEGVYKELEDLIKQIEPVELEQAGKLREVKEQAKQEAESTIAGKVSDFQSALSTPLSLFLRLRQLLHPARSSDHDHLTFARLDLPANLQDEVQATDVLRIGRMYEDLLTGGEAGKVVIAGLVSGPTGDDEENDHIHHLMTLLSASDSAQDEDATPEEGELEETPIPEVEEAQSKAPSESGLPNGDTQIEEPIQTNVNGGAAQGALNFLQDDELAEESETSDQPPQESITTIPQTPIDSTHAPTDIGSSATAVPGSFAPSSFDWAADEDLDEATEAAHIRQAFALPPSGAQTPAPTQIQAESQGKVEEQTVSTESEKPAIALIQENELANAHVSQSAVDVPTTVESSSLPAPPASGIKDIPIQGQAKGQGQGQARRGQGKGRGGNNASASNRNQQAQKVQAKPTVDEDGFQVVGRQGPQHQPGGRGRGNGNAGAGAGARGRGDGRGRGGQNQPNRGRGGAGGRGGARVPSTTGLTGEGQQGGNKQSRQSQPQQQQQRQVSQNQAQSVKTPAPTAS